MTPEEMAVPAAGGLPDWLPDRLLDWASTLIGGAADAS
jgi:hypothetical protein